MKHPFPLFFFLLFSLPILAQRDFRPGFVVNASGDTLRGLVNFRESRSQNQRCFFKPAPTASVREYTPETALGYGFTDDRIYEAVTLPRDSVTSGRRVFAWVLVRGKADLLAVGPLFYARKDGELHALNRSWKEVYVGNRWFKAEDREYERLLTAYLMADCPSIRLAGGGGVSYNVHALVRLFEIYNRCTNSAVALHESAKPWTKWEWSAYGGIDRNGLMLYSLDAAAESRVFTGAVPAFGLQVGFSSPRRSERFSTQLGIFHTSALYAGSLVVPQGLGMYRADVFLRVRSLQIPLLVRYGLNKQRVKPFVQVGIAARFNQVRTAWYQSETEVAGVVATERNDLRTSNAIPLSVLLGLGMHTNLAPHFRLTAEIRAERGLGTPLYLNGSFISENPLSGFSALIGLGLW